MTVKAIIECWGNTECANERTVYITSCMDLTHAFCAALELAGEGCTVMECVPFDGDLDPHYPLVYHAHMFVPEPEPEPELTYEIPDFIPGFHFVD